MPNKKPGRLRSTVQARNKVGQIRRTVDRLGRQDGVEPDVIASTDPRLADARAPTAHAASHQPGGADMMAVDAAAGVGSLRTIGTGALTAAAGNDGRFTDARVPTAHAASHAAGGSDPLTGSFHVTRETPSGAVDGVNVTFVLAAAPVAGSEEVYFNGLLHEPTVHYTIAGATITYLVAPPGGTLLRVSYRV